VKREPLLRIREKDKRPKPYKKTSQPKEQHLKDSFFFETTPDVSLPASQVAVHQLHIRGALTDECFHGAIQLIQAALNLEGADGGYLEEIFGGER